MIKLHQFSRTWGIPNLGQFNVKVETYLRMTGLDYEIVETLPIKAPKGKLPFIEDHGTIIADSRFIIQYLKETYGDKLDKQLSAEEYAVLVAMQRLLEEHYYWTVMYTRWRYSEQNWQTNKQAIFSCLPPVARDIVAAVYRHLIWKQIYGHGTGRHSEEKIFQLAQMDLDALSDFLAQKPYFMGDKPTSLDASAYGALVNTVSCPIESPVKDYALGKKNLVDYCERIQQEYFADL